MEQLITSGVEIRVETFFQPQHSFPALNDFVFAYRITMINHNPYTVQLMRRHWAILNGWGETEVVKGDGVVGRQPVLYAGDSYTYISGCKLETQIGYMKGEYIFERRDEVSEDKKIFKVDIPLFQLESPCLKN